MHSSGNKSYGLPPRVDPEPPRFDLEQGHVVVEPPGSGYGFWAGAPSATFDPEESRFYLYYRLRSPLTQERGGECVIAASSDGDTFEPIWSAKKASFGANSIEKGGLIRDPGGTWRLYLSYEVAQAYDRNPPTWRVDLLEADSPDGFDPSRSRPVIDGPMFGFDFVKDPFVMLVGGEYYVYANVGLPQQHEPPDQDWDGFQRRITSVLPVPPAWVAFYDGATHRADSYDEFCGLAASHDLTHFRSLSVDRPWVESPHASRSIRYVEALPVGQTLHYYYEYTRKDGAHDLRHSAVSLA